MKWAVILAGGNGSRLQPLTQALTGDDRPKQFCSLMGGQTLLAQTRARVGRYVDANRLLCVVTRAHEPYYRGELSDMKPAQIIEQPANRGTAAAIAYGLARVGRHDKKAVVGLFPADHHYDDAEQLRAVVDRTYRAARQRPDLLFLLGTQPDGPEVEYGWIEPDAPLDGLGGHVFTVGRFWEKPSHDMARTLMARGGLWNMFVMIGGLGAFRTLLDAAVPDMARAFDLVKQFPMAQGHLVESVYHSLRSVDFSKDLLGRHPEHIAVVRVPKVGWTDLGQPARVHHFLSAHGRCLPAVGVAS